MAATVSTLMEKCVRAGRRLTNSQCGPPELLGWFHRPARSATGPASGRTPGGRGPRTARDVLFAGEEIKSPDLTLVVPLASEPDVQRLIVRAGRPTAQRIAEWTRADRLVSTRKSLAKRVGPAG
jgi:hypothetical protein